MNYALQGVEDKALGISIPLVALPHNLKVVDSNLKSAFDAQGFSA